MAKQKFEYLTERIESRPPSDIESTRFINAIAEHGWRLISLDAKRYPAYDEVFLTFERPFEEAPGE
jgi:hypothetical protein